MQLREKNLAAAAAATSLQAAAQAWQHVEFGSGAERRCQLCHQRIRRWSAIRCESTGVELVIGLDCHNALAALQGTGLWPVAAIHREYRAARRFAAKQITDSMVGFLRASKLGALQEAFAFLERHGHPRTVEEGKALVAFWLHAPRPLAPGRWLHCRQCGHTDRLPGGYYRTMRVGVAVSHTCAHCRHSFLIVRP